MKRLTERLSRAMTNERIFLASLSPMHRNPARHDINVNVPITMATAAVSDAVTDSKAAVQLLNLRA